jgi:hypothetical protein
VCVDNKGNGDLSAVTHSTLFTHSPAKCTTVPVGSNHPRALISSKGFGAGVDVGVGRPFFLVGFSATLRASSAATCSSSTNSASVWSACPASINDSPSSNKSDRSTTAVPAQSTPFSTSRRVTRTGQGARLSSAALKVAMEALLNSIWCRVSHVTAQASYGTGGKGVASSPSLASTAFFSSLSSAGGAGASDSLPPDRVMGVSPSGAGTEKVTSKANLAAVSEREGEGA